MERENVSEKPSGSDRSPRTRDGQGGRERDQMQEGQPREGAVTKKVEQYTAQVPSIAYLSLAIGSMVTSAAIALFSERKSLANFIGLWVPTLMLVGIYNKLVKIEGSDRFSRIVH